MAAVNLKWDLPQKIVEMSRADNFTDAAKEWSLFDIDMLEPGDYSECLCGHWPIREICSIRNRITRKTAEVGNCCIKKFEKEYQAFEGVHKTFDSAKKLKANPLTASANQELVELAYRKGVLNNWEIKFYTNTWLKRSLSYSQQVNKVKINYKILLGVVYTAREAFQHLKKNCNLRSASPKLINFAFKQKVLNINERQFYLDIWNRNKDKLSGKQAKWKLALNQKLVRSVEVETEGEPADRSSKRQKTGDSMAS